MWPAYVFLALLAVVLLQTAWQTWRNRKQRAIAHQQYTAALLKQQQEANLQAEAQRQALFNSMMEAVLLLDPHNRISLVNRSLTQLFKLPAEVGGRPVAEVISLPELPQLIERLKVEKNIVGFELDLPGEKVRRLQVNASVVVDRSGVQQGALFVFHDLTRQKELENIRQEFVGNVSHELRTPLSLIKGFTETLLTGAKDDPEAAVRFLQKIDKHADRLLFLIEDLLTISRLESGQLALNRQQVLIHEIVERVFEDVEARACEAKVTLQNRIPGEAHVWADADRLQQVLFNLVDNAIKYGRPEGHVTVGSCETSNGLLEICVADDGSGIPAEALGRIFERFYRVDRARSRETGGTGLGLAIVKHIVQAHGGEVRVKSELNRGTAFSFTMPIAGAPSRQWSTMGVG